MEGRTLPTCWLDVIMAREAPRAVIFRQGPSKRVELILWHTDTDEFVHGQWFKGIIDTPWADLSPDGTKLIYMAKRYNRLQWLDKETGPYWTAISKPPYLTAVAFWPGVTAGSFDANDAVTLYDSGWGPNKAHLYRVPEGLKVRFFPKRSWQEFVSHYRKWKGLPYDSPLWASFEGKMVDVWYRSDPSGQYHILRTSRYGGWGGWLELCRVVNSAGEPVVDAEGVSCADWEQRGRLVLGKEGRLWIGEPGDGGFQMRELADFREDQFEPVVAPDWAKVW